MSTKQVVYKYIIPMNDVGIVTMPAGDKILKIADQHGHIAIWAQHDCRFGGVVFERRSFAVVGTGMPIVDAKWQYLDTVLIAGGDLVFHIYEIDPK